VRRPKEAIAACALLAALLALVGCGDDASRSSARGDDVVGVVAAENFWGNVVAQLGGTHVHVTSIIHDPSADPHLYESDPEDAAAVADADLVVINGLELDDAVARLLSGAKNGQPKLSVAEVLDVHGDEANPHLWYDVPRVPEVARAIVAELAHLDPANAPTYDANLAAFDRALQPVLALLDEIKVAHAGARVAYTERVAGYLLAAAGLDVRTPPGFASAVEEGDEPSPADMQAMNALLAQRRVRALVYNSQATSTATEHARDLAQEAGIPIVAMSETLPKNEPDYQSWQLHQLEALRAALDG
jgi:zinc/manganese transport system substrate-binding protein